MGPYGALWDLVVTRGTFLGSSCLVDWLCVSILLNKQSLSSRWHQSAIHHHIIIWRLAMAFYGLLELRHKFSHFIRASGWLLLVANNCSKVWWWCLCSSLLKRYLFPTRVAVVRKDARRPLGSIHFLHFQQGGLILSCFWYVLLQRIRQRDLNAYSVTHGLNYPHSLSPDQPLLERAAW